jgi:hypothetical protein
MTTSSKHEAVLDICDEQPFEGAVLYEQLNEDNGELDEQYLMTIDMYGELGQPTQITVTVRPGDHLNVESPADHIGGTPVVPRAEMA